MKKYILYLNSENQSTAKSEEHALKISAFLRETGIVEENDRLAVILRGSGPTELTIIE